MVLLIAGTSIAARAQIEVSPTRVLLSMRERSREVNVLNTTDNQSEVEVELGYKLFRYDSIGAITLDSARTELEHAKSGKEWLKIYPKRFSLPPHGSRLVRVMVTIPDSAAEGEYWGRVVVTSTPVARVNADDTTSGIQTNLMMRLQVDLPVIIRKGAPGTGIEFDAMRGMARADETLFLLDMHRTGNAAYRGTIRAALTGGGTEIAKVEEQYTAEFAYRQALHFPKLKDGGYRLAVESVSVKKGGANDAVIQSPTVSKNYGVTVSGGNVTIVPSN
ncbi:MAG: hypothetical protein JWQ98_1293 [Chlorobi bacterium]|nr:hypothetical protein [Chlorobiota bacterium]